MSSFSESLIIDKNKYKILISRWNEYGICPVWVEYEYRKSHVEYKYEYRLAVLEYEYGIAVLEYESEYSGCCTRVRTRVPSSRTRVRVQVQEISSWGETKFKCDDESGVTYWNYSNQRSWQSVALQFSIPFPFDVSFGPRRDFVSRNVSLSFFPLK